LASAEEPVGRCCGAFWRLVVAVAARVDADAPVLATWGALGWPLVGAGLTVAD
jgi:hypothetical protein